MKCRSLMTLAVAALCGSQAFAEEAAPVAPAAAAPVAAVAVPAAQDEGAAAKQQMDAVRAKLKLNDKAMNAFRQKVSKDPAVVEAKTKMEEARKAYDAAQRQALAAIPEAVGLLAELDALKVEEKALMEKEAARRKPVKGKKQAD